MVPKPEDLKKARVERRKGEGLKVTQRPIQHPLYKNISMADAATLLTPDTVEVRLELRVVTRGVVGWACGCRSCKGMPMTGAAHLVFRMLAPNAGSVCWLRRACRCTVLCLAVCWRSARRTHARSHAACSSAAAQVGECVIRPSHTGPMKLCLTIKMPEGVWHLDLLEQGKVGCPSWTVEALAY